MFSGIMAVVAVWNHNENFGLLNILDLPPAIETGIALLLFDGWMYLWHRANHEIPFLWRFHRMHHSDREIDVTSSHAISHRRTDSLLNIETWGNPFVRH